MIGERASMPDNECKELSAGVARNNGASEVVLPLYVEEISVSKRVVPKNSVHVSRITREHEEVVSELLAHERVEVERVAIGKPLEEKPSVREEGDTIIVPVVEEIAVIERHLILKEEIRIRRIRSEEQHRERVVLRKQEAEIKREPIDFRSAVG
jgi:stress response protein YsnF